MTYDRIWKYEVTSTFPEPEYAIPMKEGARILSTAFQGTSLVVWALVNAAATDVLRLIVVVPTGRPIPPKVAAVNDFIGTAVVGSLVFHVFDLGELR